MRENDEDRVEAFTTAERNLIRLTFRDQLGGPRSLDEGIFLHCWASGPNKGQPRLNKPVQSLLARGLVKVVNLQGVFAFARFTPAGFRALKAMAKNRTLLRPDRYRSLLEELQTK